MPVELNDARFTPASSGRFMERPGRLRKGASYSDKKVCLVATDAATLIDLLYALSLREDCWSVKYGTVPRDGMYLGRCSLATDRAAAELCHELKGHPRLMVSLQDDSVLREFREDPIAAGRCGVWDDWPEHAAEVANVHHQAFGRPNEAALVEAVRSAGAATVSLVAQLAPQDRVRERWPVVGHILLSPVSVEGSSAAEAPRGLGLGPLAVLPAQQRKGFGASLVEAALSRAKLLGYAYVVVLGHPAYYPRFGFVPASRFGLRFGDLGPREAFMALQLVSGALEGVSGAVRYLPAFHGV